MRFTIRDLLWLMAVVGLSLGWWNQTVRYASDTASWQQANMDNAVARTDAVVQMWNYKRELAKAEAKLKAAAAIQKASPTEN